MRTSCLISPTSTRPIMCSTSVAVQVPPGGGRPDEERGSPVSTRPARCFVSPGSSRVSVDPRARSHGCRRVRRISRCLTSRSQCVGRSHRCITGPTSMAAFRGSPGAPAGRNLHCAREADRTRRDRQCQSRLDPAASRRVRDDVDGPRVLRRHRRRPRPREAQSRCRDRPEVMSSAPAGRVAGSAGRRAGGGRRPRGTFSPLRRGRRQCSAITDTTNPKSRRSLCQCDSIECGATPATRPTSATAPDSPFSGSTVAGTPSGSDQITAPLLRATVQPPSWTRS